MRSTLYLSASAFIALASAQTFTACNPMEKDCPNDPAIAATFETNFKAGKDAVKGWKSTTGSLSYSAEGADFVLAKKGDGPTIQSEGYLHFGYVEVKMKAAPGAGIVSSIVLQSENLDETDWEFIGSIPNKVQMNYFGKGNTTTYDRMIEAPIGSHLEMHTYALNWTSEALTWLIDDKPQRTLKYAEANGGKNFPQTPCNVRIGIWAGGDSESQGTIEWAGGKPDYSKAPFVQTVESVKVINYNPGKEYEWTDKSGSYQSIKVIEPGKKEGSAVNDKTLTPATGGSSSSGNSTAPIVEAGKPSGDGKPAADGKPSGGAPGAQKPGSDDDDEECVCDGTATVTMTGTPPPAVPATSAPATSTPAASAPVSAPVPSAPATSAPAVSAPPPAGTQPPYPIIKTDTRTPPSVTAPTGGIAIPTGGAGGNSTTPFTGAASSHGAGSSLVAVFGAVVAVFAL